MRSGREKAEWWASVLEASPFWPDLLLTYHIDFWFIAMDWLGAFLSLMAVGKYRLEITKRSGS